VRALGDAGGVSGRAEGVQKAGACAVVADGGGDFRECGGVVRRGVAEGY
jgi:hypothetical protein